MATAGLDRASRAALYALLVGAALARGVLEWRRTPLDLPLALLLALVLVMLQLQPDQPDAALPGGR